VSEPRPPQSGRPRRLDRAPGERFAAGPRASAPTSSDAAPSAGRRDTAIAVAAAVIAAGAIVILVGSLGTMTGLLFAAGVSGFVIGARVPMRPALVLTLGAVIAGDLGTWLVARSEGGVLGIGDYLFATFGPYLTGQLAIGALSAWWAARRAAAIRGGEARRG